MKQSGTNAQATPALVRMGHLLQVGLPGQIKLSEEQWPTMLSHFERLKRAAGWPDEFVLKKSPKM
jgi:hypothetical protein